MTSMMLDMERSAEARVVLVADSPITFQTFLEITGQDDDLELVNGVLVERMSAQLDHERLFVWLQFVLNGFVSRHGLGTVLGSRSAVQISEYDGRLPDILFVRADREHILQQKAIYGAPDLVIELVSPTDQPGELMTLETDYRTIGVAEIVFVDRLRRRLRIVRRRTDAAGPADYDEQILTSGTLALATVPGFAVEVTALFDEPRPDPLTTLNALLARSGDQS